MGRYQKLLAEISYFSQTDFKGVFTRPFFQHVIAKSHDPQKQDFTLVYGDFNRLNDINCLYSKHEGDMILATTYDKIQELLNLHFPTVNHSISRFGGDEFIIIIDTCDSKRIADCITEINYVLSSNSLANREQFYKPETLANHKPNYVDFSCGIIDSHETCSDTIYNMITEAEKRQLLQKLSPVEQEDDFEACLKLRAENSVAKFFKNFRFSSFLDFHLEEMIQNEKPMHQKGIRELFLTSINSLFSLLQNPEKIAFLATKLTELETPPTLETNTLFSQQQCQEINEFIQNGNFDTVRLPSFNTNELATFLNLLIREPISGCYNKSYLHHYFFNEFSQSTSDFSTAILVDTTHMKDSNLKIGHSYTDQKMKQMSNLLQDKFETLLNSSFSQDNFNLKKERNYIFDLGGGDYLLLFRQSVTSKLVQSLLEDTITNCQPLGAVYAMENTKGRKDLSTIIKNLYSNCNQKKHVMKSENLVFSDDMITETFQMFLAPTLQYYLQHQTLELPNIKEMKKLVNVISNAMINQVSKCIQDYTTYQKSHPEEFKE